MTHAEKIQELLGVSREEYLHGMTDVYLLMIQRPYPSGPIITDYISKKYPTLPQRIIFAYVQQLKQYIHEAQYGPLPTHAAN